MPKNKFNTSDLAAMSPQDIVALNFKDLRTATRQLVDIVNKRIKRAEKSGLKQFQDDYDGLASFSLARFNQEYGSELSLKGKSDVQLRSIMRNAQKVLNAESGSLGGINKRRKRQAKQFNVPIEKLDDFWDAYNKFKELHPIEMYKNPSGDPEVTEDGTIIRTNKIQEMLSDLINENSGLNIDSMVKIIQGRLEREEERKMKIFDIDSNPLSFKFTL